MTTVFVACFRRGVRVEYPDSLYFGGLIAVWPKSFFPVGRWSLCLDAAGNYGEHYAIPQLIAPRSAILCATKQTLRTLQIDLWYNVQQV